MRDSCSHEHLVVLALGEHPSHSQIATLDSLLTSMWGPIGQKEQVELTGGFFADRNHKNDGCGPISSESSNGLDDRRPVDKRVRYRCFAFVYAVCVR